MQTRKPLLFFLCLVLFVSLACVTTTEPFVTYPADTPTAIGATVTVTVSPSPSPSPLTTPLQGASRLPAGEGNASQCAVVTADESLHLRAYDDATSQVLGYMESGEVVKLLNTKNPEWWMIKHEDMLGYARSKYLEKIECGS